MIARWACGVLAVYSLHAAALAAAPDVSGEFTAGVWSSNRLLDDRGATPVARLRAALDWQPMPDVSFNAEGWIAASPEQRDGRRRAAGLRELYVLAPLLPCRPAVGQRVVVWGKTDGINPTDQVSPTDLRRLVSKDAEQRTGVWGLHLNCAAGPGRLQLHLLDGFRFNAVPLPASAGVTISETEPRVRPTLAVRYEMLGSAADGALGWIEGHDLFPTLAVRSASAQGVQLETTATRTRLLGGDLAFTRNALVYRGEIAWVEPVGDAAAGVVAARRHGFVQAVAQVEASFAERETLSMQVFAKQLRGAQAAPADPLLAQLQAAQGLLSNEVDRRQAGITLRYAKPLWASRADVELFALWAHPQREWLLRGRLNVEINAAWRLVSGFEVFRGPRESFLGHLRANSLAFTELRFAW